MFIVLILGGILSAPAQALFAQSFDYERYPKLDFDFTHMQLEMGLQPQNMRMNGAVTYQVKANISGADTVTLYAAHMEISAASVDGERVEFQLKNDSLLIPLLEPAERGQNHEIWVRYSTTPGFGLLKNNNGTVWTSQLPRAQRHWVPILDNPHVAMPTDLKISVPAEFTAWATGRKVGEEAVNEEVTQYNFVSKTDIPASELAFAIGNFQSQSTTFGIKRINMAVEQEPSGEVDLQQLLQQSYDWLGKVETEMQSEFPYERLNIVIMNDHGWETKSWGGGTIFIYQNRGSLQHQLLRGIIGQWIGSSQRAAQWSEADAITLYQTLVQQSMTGSTPTLDVQDLPRQSTPSVYDVFGPERWNAWQQQWLQWKEQSKAWMISDTHPGMLEQLSPVVQWSDYADLWYQKSGQPMFEIPRLTVAHDTSAADTTVADSVIYRVRYNRDLAGESITLGFEAVQGGYDELKTLRLHKVYAEGIETGEVTFTGLSDSVTVSVSPDIRTLRLEVPQELRLGIEEHKPVPFLIYELRNAESLNQRVRAARNLGKHTDNPDLQLAIVDALEGNVEPDVRAALLMSLADITRGAAGTEQLFLEALQSESRLVQKAGLKALQNYPESVEIQKRVRQMTASTNHIAIFKQGISVLSGIATQEELDAFLSEVARRDTVGYRSVAAIRQLASKGETGMLTEAERFLGGSYDYGVRQEALEVLTEYDENAQNWLQRGRELLTESRDPRIRFLVVRGLLQHQNSEIVSFLSEYLSDEYDARVYRAISEGMR